ncbi:MAG: type IX secretion system protein PorQ [Prevotella sp.]|nr:type IX secretion system protein PorQ [Prevotella sp.]
MNRTAAITLVLLSCAVMPMSAQDSDNVFNFLRLPASAHVSALGGDNITLVENDASLVFHNPALISYVSDKTINLNAMTYMEGSVTASASFTKALGDRATWGVQGRFISYGEMKETTITGEQTGTFGARDVALSGSFAYGLAEHLSGGVTAKMVGSFIGNYSSLGVLVDLGLNYYDADREWSLSAVARNLGGQVKAYEDDFEPVPLDLQLGVTKRLVGSPLRFSATLVRLNDWQYGLGKHLVVGADLLLGDQFYIAAGYNPLRAAQMKIKSGDGESSHGAALSLGAGMTLERLQLHLAYAKYHVSSTSLLLTFSYIL